MGFPGVSVVIAVRNSERSIGSCVESVLASRYPADQMEVICVDNHSTDRTLDALRQFQPRIQVLEEKRRGAGAARNAGLRVASRELVAFTDADCTVHPDWLGNIVKPVQAGAGAAGGRILARPEAGPVERFGELIHNHAWAIQCDRPPYLITMNMASRLALLHSIGMFDERWLRMQDCDIAYRLVAAGERLAYQDDAVIYHHNRDTLAGLAREGFRHGYYLPAFLGVHGTFMRDYQQRMAGTPVPPPVRRPLPELEPWRQRLYWRVFRTAKSAGIWKGRLFPPPIR